MDSNGWTRYEKLVLSKLTDLEDAVDDLARRVTSVEREALSPDRVGDLIAKALEKKEARGWTLRAQLISAFVALLALSTFLLTAYTALRK